VTRPFEIFLSDGRTLALASSDCTIRLWDVITGDEVQRLEGHCDWASVVTFSPDGKTLALASYDRTIRLWDRTTGNKKGSLEMDEVPKSLSFSRDGRHLKTDRAFLTLNLSFDNTFPEEKLPENGLSYRGPGGL
jgi:WD40 repeat protein